SPRTCPSPGDVPSNYLPPRGGAPVTHTQYGAVGKGVKLVKALFWVKGGLSAAALSSDGPRVVAVFGNLLRVDSDRKKSIIATYQDVKGKRVGMKEEARSSMETEDRKTFPERGGRGNHSRPLSRSELSRWPLKRLPGKSLSCSVAASPPCLFIYLPFENPNSFLTAARRIRAKRSQ
ncbi:hypothetical protein BaRGS_00032813, partial [Batillaria attramentaria]